MIYHRVTPTLLPLRSGSQKPGSEMAKMRASHPPLPPRKEGHRNMAAAPRQSHKLREERSRTNCLAMSVSIKELPYQQGLGIDTLNQRPEI